MQIIMYTIFSDADEALEVAKHIVQEKRNVECGIYGIDQKIILSITPDNAGKY